jgi:hypothetical protein
LSILGADSGFGLDRKKAGKVVNPGGFEVRGWTVSTGPIRNCGKVVYTGGRSCWSRFCQGRKSFKDGGVCGLKEF